MKKIFTLAVASLFGIAANAQSIAMLNGSQASKFGIKVGMNFPTMRITGDNVEGKRNLSMSTNYQLTGFVDFNVSPSFSFQPGISIQGKGYKTSNFASTSIANQGITQSVTWLEVPLKLMGKIQAGPGNLILGGGGYGAYGLGGQAKGSFLNEGLNQTTVRKVQFDSTPDIKRIDYGVNMTAGYQLQNGLSFDTSYSMGLNNLMPTNSTNTQGYNRVVSFSLGYSF